MNGAATCTHGLFTRAHNQQARLSPLPLPPSQQHLNNTQAQTHTRIRATQMKAAFARAALCYYCCCKTIVVRWSPGPYACVRPILHSHSQPLLYLSITCSRATKHRIAGTLPHAQCMHTATAQLAAQHPNNSHGMPLTFGMPLPLPVLDAGAERCECVYYESVAARFIGIQPASHIWGSTTFLTPASQPTANKPTASKQASRPASACVSHHPSPPAMLVGSPQVGAYEAAHVLRPPCPIYC